MKARSRKPQSASPFSCPFAAIKRLTHNPQWRIGNFGENYDAHPIHHSCCRSKTLRAPEPGERDERSRIGALVGHRENGHRFPAAERLFGPPTKLQSAAESQ